MLNLNDLNFFVAAVEQGSFAAAGRRLDVPKSTVSKRVAELEQALAARLVHRTSRSFALTDVGQSFYEHAKAALIEAEAAVEVVQRRAAEPSGRVRLTASVPVTQQYLAPHLPALAKAYPRLHVQLDVSDRYVDLVQEGYDMAVRSHFAPLPDSELVQRPLAREPLILVAAPGYARERPLPARPEGLQPHHGLLSGAAAGTWRLTSTGQPAETVSVTPQARATANESSVLLSLAAAEVGIACLPASMCRQAMAARQLVRVLDEWVAGYVATTLVMPHRRGQLPGVRAVVDFLVEKIGEAEQGAA
ncbi:LysR substrate-binding domain-containing protein [Bordetella petrii]|uniref:LysR substrate-binding domain-containing protein n=1 Tax=Bordetella petrii TaxID=94624 RepID=UPI001E4E1528|nr:LysR substrate-binding domain-containing protein [Bordetella petrii]MCD0503627.1 LysR substrate-binding domain-containing protein [Bordetella petrii]